MKLLEGFYKGSIMDSYEVLLKQYGATLDTVELSKLLKWSTHTVISHRTKGTGPKWSRIGRSIRYQLSDVLDWLNSLKDGDE
jgi:predicted DNA-binding transcriptional regulator AlpA|tara:strand:+ start:46 stop:291 length:246 start_codon:yes stop_codon:yes gene_type:complete